MSASTTSTNITITDLIIYTPQQPWHKMFAPITTTPNTTTTTTPPRKQKPTLTLKPITVPPPPYTFNESPDSLYSCFSPFSTDNEYESDDESDDEPESPVPPRGRPSWAYPPSMPPSGPPPAVPSRPAVPARFPSFCSVSTGTPGCLPVFSPGPNTPAFPQYGMPSAPTVPSTPYSPDWSTAAAPMQPPRVDSALSGLEAQLMAALGGQPPQELVIARKERDVLVVMVQKAYYRRDMVGVNVLNWELAKAEVRVKDLEEKWVMAVLSGVEAMVGNIKAEMMAPHVQEQYWEEDNECAVESDDEEEEEIFEEEILEEEILEEEILEVFQHKVIEPEVESPKIPAHEERRFIWVPTTSAFDDDSDSESEAGSDDGYNYDSEYYDGYDSDSEYDDDDGYNSDRLSVPALLHSASSSQASLSPIIPGGNEWPVPFNAPVDGSEEKKLAGALVLRIAGVEMEMI